MFVFGSLRTNGWKLKSIIPEKLTLKSGHLNFFKDKLLYIKRRQDGLKQEIIKRGFKCDGFKIDLNEVPNKFLLNNWQPQLVDSILLRERIIFKLKNKDKPFWRFNSQVLVDNELNLFCNNLLNSFLNEY